MQPLPKRAPSIHAPAEHAKIRHAGLPTTDEGTDRAPSSSALLTARALQPKKYDSNK